MNKSIVFMFSGQGSQYYNMGRELYLSNSTFCKCMEELDGIFYSMTDKSLLEVLYDSSRQKSEPFDDILYTHAAIFMVEYSLTQVLLEEGIYPDYVLGASLGEFTCCAVAGVLSCEDVLQCLIRQAQMLKDYCLQGGMLAVINDYRLYDEEPMLHNNSELISINYDSHFVVAGSTHGLSVIEGYLKPRSVIFQRLPVAFAFHSSLIEPLALDYIEFLKTKIYRNPRISFISSMTGGSVAAINSSHLWNVVRKPIEFQNAIRGLDNEKECIYIDLGPSGTLANFTKYNVRYENRSNVFTVISPFNNEMKNLEKLCKVLG